ncbi:MAG: hypothetical protein WBM09_11665 [Gallionella sp.]
MLRCGNQITLHQPDADRLFQLTSVRPAGIRTVDDLNRFIDRHLQDFEDGTPESRLLKLMLAGEKITPGNVSSSQS